MEKSVIVAKFGRFYEVLQFSKICFFALSLRTIIMVWKPVTTATNEGLNVSRICENNAIFELRSDTVSP